MRERGREGGGEEERERGKVRGWEGNKGGSDVEGRMELEREME